MNDVLKKIYEKTNPTFTVAVSVSHTGSWMNVSAIEPELGSFKITAKDLGLEFIDLETFLEPGEVAERFIAFVRSGCGKLINSLMNTYGSSERDKVFRIDVLRSASHSAVFTFTFKDFSIFEGCSYIDLLDRTYTSFRLYRRRDEGERVDENSKVNFIGRELFSFVGPLHFLPEMTAASLRLLEKINTPSHSTRWTETAEEALCLYTPFFKDRLFQFEWKAGPQKVGYFPVFAPYSHIIGEQILELPRTEWIRFMTAVLEWVKTTDNEEN